MLGKYYTINSFLMAPYGLFVLKVPLNPNHQLIQLTELLTDGSRKWWFRLLQKTKVIPVISFKVHIYN